MFVYCDFNKLTCFNVGQVMENTTLFTYSPGENISTYANTSFVPIFLDEPINFATDELRVAAELACQGGRELLVRHRFHWRCICWREHQTSGCTN